MFGSLENQKNRIPDGFIQKITLSQENFIPSYTDDLIQLNQASQSLKRFAQSLDNVRNH